MPTISREYEKHLKQGAGILQQNEHILREALEKYIERMRDNIAEMEKISQAQETPNGLVTNNGAKMLAGTFREQQEQAQRVLDAIRAHLEDDSDMPDED